MGRRAPSIELLPRQRAILERLGRARTLERRLAERVQIMLGCDEGKTTVELAKKLDVDAQRVARWRHVVERRVAELETRADRVLAGKRQRFEAAKLQLEERSPFRILERGYAIAYDDSGKVLRSTDQVALGEDISVRLARGELGATVKRKKDFE